MMSALPKLRFTPEEYLELEERAEYKSQYVDGEIFAMAGGEPWHNQIAYNIAGELRNLFRGRACSGFTSDTRARIKAADMYTYPDVSALCGKPVFETADKPRSLLNPQVIFEVLSPSTEACDRGRKFERYQLLDSLPTTSWFPPRGRARSCSPDRRTEAGSTAITRHWERACPYSALVATCP